MEMSPGNAEKIMNALTAFKTYKKPKTLPDRLRLSRKHLESVRKWRSMAKKKLKKGTFTSLTQLASYLPFYLGEMDEDEDDNEDVTFVLGKSGADAEKIDSEEPLQEFQGKSSIAEPVLSVNDMFPDFFNAERNDWDDDWQSDDEDEGDDATDLLFGNLSGNQLKFDSRVGEKMEDIVGSFGGMMENFTETLIPSAERFMAKEICYEPYKRAKEAFETWLEENRASMGLDSIREREHQLQQYRDIVAVYEQMDDNDDEDKQKLDMMKIQTLNAKIAAVSGLLPVEVQTAQDEAAQSVFLENPNILNETLGTVLPQMGQMMNGFLEPFAQPTSAAGEDEALDTDLERTENCTIL